MAILSSSSVYGDLLVSGDFKISQQIISNLADGTMPFIITSTTKSDNLNADLLDGYHASSFSLTSHPHGNITNDGKIGTTANLIVKTTTGGALTTLAAGSSGQYLAHNGAWATPPNTTYAAGAGLTLTGTVFTPTFGATSGTVCQGNDSRLSDARTPTSHASSATTFGISTSSLYGHAMASSATPLVAGTASAGTDNGKFACENHVHPAQTTITGNAATATKLAASKTISLTTDATGSASFDGSANASIAVTLANSGITAGTYNSVTVDAKGRVTNGSNVTIPSITSASAILYSGNWSSSNQTVTVSGVTSSNIVLITSDSADYYLKGISCTAQGTNTLTFHCNTTPTANITVKVVIIS